MTNQNMTDAFFAGRVFVPGEQDGFRFFLWGEGGLPIRNNVEMAFISSFAEPADGSFLCKVKDGWLFVTGVGEHENFRHTFFDNSPEADANAQAMQALGIALLSLEEGNARVKADGVALYSVTADELRRTQGSVST